MSERMILLVEDNPNDEALTLRALKKSNILNPVHVARDGADLVLTLGDDGSGFDLGEARGRGGLGLISLDERVRLAGGRLVIDTQPQEGAEIRVVVPLRQGDAA